jgi:hypothetical protein
MTSGAILPFNKFDEDGINKSEIKKPILSISLTIRSQ